MAKRTKADDSVARTPDEGLAEADDDSPQSDPQSTGTSSGRDSVVDSAKEAASQAKEAASHVFEHAKDQAATRADQQRETVASSIQAVANAFRSMGDNVRNQDQGPVGRYAAELGEAIGGQAERLANYLRGRDVRHLVADTEDFARRSPAVFLGGAFALGLLASRFLKSSRPAPDFIANMPDPNRALPPASTPITDLGPKQPYEVGNAG